MSATPGYRKMTTCWVSKHLSVHHKPKCLGLCLQPLILYISTNGALLDGIITNSEEMQGHHGMIETKMESMTWKHMDSLNATSSKQSTLVQNYSHGFLGCQRSVGGLPTQRWDSQCSMLQHAGQTDRSCSTAVLSSSMTMWHPTQSRWPHIGLNSTDGKCCSIHHTVQNRHFRLPTFQTS
jgi:hypothetical protein